ncbi:hypothetical protein CEXT_474291 [Caerostris extrusa]|uniref:Uncharacterized protein n=1 Tax=Caerostris extrusa TaxID=172846 RepID=A0AAV4N823_CAEEX|nr:hypothetical protein CEXT_474291 [Caerostris extrusa]
MKHFRFSLVFQEERRNFSGEIFKFLFGGDGFFKTNLGEIIPQRATPETGQKMMIRIFADLPLCQVRPRVDKHVPKVAHGSLGHVRPNPILLTVNSSQQIIGLRIASPRLWIIGFNLRFPET